MGEWIVLGTACTLGFLHALEVDHMLAVTAFVTRRPGARVAAAFGARWGLGHGLAVLLAGSVLLLLGLRWPERFDRWGEAAVGVMLAALGAWAVVSARRLHLHAEADHGHTHLHLHGGGARRHDHPHHAHERGRPHHHGGITLVGLMHGIAGTGGALALVPITLADRPAAGVGYLLAFGLGTTVSMTLFATAMAVAMDRAAERSLAWGRRIATAAGVAGIVVGAWWVHRALA